MKYLKEEEQIQRSFIYWFRKNYHDIPTGMSPITKLSPAKGARMKAMGYSKGWPDIFIPRPNKGYMGLFIEFKSRTGKIDKEYQEPMLNYLNDNGYKAIVCRELEDAIQVVQSYFKS